MIIGVHGRGLARVQAESLGAELGSSGADYEVRLAILDEIGGSNTALHDDHVAEHRGEIGQLHAKLRAGEIDVVIHRGFDLRGDIPDDLRIGAVLPRQNPYDVLLATDELWLDELDSSHRVGVVQLRARAQLLDYRPDLEWNLVGGDAADWIQALLDGTVHALIAPGAAIEQLQLQERVCEIFPPELLVPAPGSGILVCLIRADDEASRTRLRVLHDQGALVEYTAEVALVEALGGVWEQPIGALARLDGEMLQMSAVVAAADGSTILRDQYVTDADDPHAAGEEFAALLLQAGAAELLSQTHGADPLANPAVAGKLPSGRSGETGPEDEFFDFEEFDHRTDDDTDDPEAW